MELEVLARRERLAAHVAQVVAFTGVHARVTAQRVGVSEAALAHAAAQLQGAGGRLGVRARAVRQQAPAHTYCTVHTHTHTPTHTQHNPLTACSRTPRDTGRTRTRACPGARPPRAAGRARRASGLYTHTHY